MLPDVIPRATVAYIVHKEKDDDKDEDGDTDELDDIFKFN